MMIFLVYHKVGESVKDGIYSIAGGSFAKQIERAKDAGLPVIDPREITEEGPVDKKGIVFTFDDGTRGHFETVLPLLRAAGIKGLFYISTGKLNKEGYLTDEQVKIMHTEGHTIGSHGVNHARLDRLSDARVREELDLSARDIFKITGRKPVHFAPCGGYFNAKVRDAARDSGHRFFRTMRWGYNDKFDPMLIEAIPVVRGPGAVIFNLALMGKCALVVKSAFLIKNLIRGATDRSSI